MSGNINREKKKGHVDSNADTSTQTPSCISREEDPFVNNEKKKTEVVTKTREKSKTGIKAGYWAENTS